jgi:phosphatidylglycerophosphate synthase
MATVDPQLADPAPDRPTRGAVADLGVAAVVALGAVAGTWWLLGLPASFALLAAAVTGALLGVVWRTLPDDLAGPGVGPANRVTLNRAMLSVPVLTLAVHPVALGSAGHWLVIALSTAVLVLDGVDGRIARRTGTTSAFGARFDMELDAALLMALSMLVWRSGKVGAWVLLIGLMRYGFVAAGAMWPALGSELPPSLRRKVVCVVQGVVLLVALGPIVSVRLAVAVSATGLLALTWSFAVDVRGALGAEAAR